MNRACRKAKIPEWSPNRLRHNAATRIRKEFGIEAAQIILGHSKVDATQVYAERDESRAEKIMKKTG
ncbi:tyrosine-type recombinase/integrase [Symmachiella dynata]|uniref:tyrosine-type recombinase/integrase n=1 Tax=Symmachiella dynata TaxID=2527995 RepID=UPI003C6FD8A1